MITASSTITQIAAPLARIPPLSWRDTRRVTDGRAGLIASRRGGVGAPPRATVPRRRCVVVTANGRHSRSKLRDKEDARERAALCSGFVYLDDVDEDIIYSDDGN